MKARFEGRGMKPHQVRSEGLVFLRDHAILEAEEEKADIGVKGLGVRGMGKGWEGECGLSAGSLSVVPVMV